MTKSLRTNRVDVYLVKTDENGNEVWSKTFGKSAFNKGSSVQLTSDGGYIIAGLTERSGAKLDVWLIKVGEAKTPAQGKEENGTPPTETKTPSNDFGIPGFGAVFALVGLLTVAYLMREAVP